MPSLFAWTFGIQRTPGNGRLLMEMFTVFVLLVAVLLLILFLFFFCFIRVWVKALLSGCPIMLPRLIGMRLRGNPPALIVDVLVVLRASGIDVSVDEIERVYMANKHSLRWRDDKQRQVQELVQLVKHGLDTTGSDGVTS